MKHLQVSFAIKNVHNYDSEFGLAESGIQARTQQSLGTDQK